MPLEWYKDELHVGYDRDGRKVLRGPRRDRMDRLLAQADGGAGWRTVYDDYNGEEIVLSKEEFGMIQRIREGRFPHVEVIPVCVLAQESIVASAGLRNRERVHHGQARKTDNSCVLLGGSVPR